MRSFVEQGARTQCAKGEQGIKARIYAIYQTTNAKRNALLIKAAKIFAVLLTAIPIKFSIIATLRIFANRNANSVKKAAVKAYSMITYSTFARAMMGASISAFFARTSAHPKTIVMTIKPSLLEFGNRIKKQGRPHR